MSTTFGALPPPAPMTRRPILATKLFVPVGGGELVAREQLLARLNAGAHDRLTIISAPAGFGKTTLVSTWHASDQRSSELAWFSVDSSDNDPARFLAYLCAALKYDDPLLDTAMLLPDQIELVSAGLVNTLSRRSERVVLVLDDYHAIDNPDVHMLVGHLIDNAPPQLHVVIISRLDLPLPLARLRAGGHLNEIHADDLRFSVDEVQALFTSMLDYTLSADDAALLTERTEGWAAGIILAGLSIQRRGDPRVVISNFRGSNRYVFDYLAEEVLRRQPDELRTFLLCTSILSRVCAPLGDSLTGRRNGQRMLAAAEHANLFVTPLDDERRWYRYHHLFAEFLTAQLHEHDPALAQELHRRAGAWFHAHGLDEEAVDHALRGSDYPSAVTIIRDVGPQLLMQGQPVTVRDWVQALPLAELANEPDLCLILSGALFYTGELEAVPAKLDLAETWLHNHQDDHDWNKLTGRVATLRAMLAAFRGSLDEALRHAVTAQEHLPADDLRFIGIATYMLGIGTFANDFKGGRDLIERSIPLLDADGNLVLGFQARNSLCAIYTDEGRLREVERICHAIEHSPLGRTAAGGALVNLTMAALLQEWNRLDEAEERVRRALDYSGRQGILTAELTARGRLAIIRVSQGRLREALAMFNEIDAEARAHGLVAMFDDDLDSWRAVIQIRLGDLDAAAEWASAKGYAQVERYRVTQGQHYRGYARLLIAQQRVPAALAVLDQWLELALDAGLAGTATIEALLLIALAEAQRGDRERAFAAVARALAYGEPEGYIRTFADEGEPLAVILHGLRSPAVWERHAASLGVTRGYLGRLLDTLMSDTTAHDAAHADANAALIEPLSERELEVLRLLAQGLPNSAIADKLFVAIGTVKAHTYNVYQKLGVTNRTQAGIRARELGLL